MYITVELILLGNAEIRVNNFNVKQYINYSIVDNNEKHTCIYKVKYNMKNHKVHVFSIIIIKM